MPPLYSATRKQASASHSRGSNAAPGTYPASDVHPSARQSATFLPLRLCDEMRLRGWRLFSARTGAIGHRWMESCVYSVAVSLGCIPNVVGAIAYSLREMRWSSENGRIALSPRLPLEQTILFIKSLCGAKVPEFSIFNFQFSIWMFFINKTTKPSRKRRFCLFG